MAIAMRPQLALFSAGGGTSLEWAPKFAEANCTVIDNSSAWRMDPTKKLVVPEVNGSVLTPEDKIIANPNCSTAQLMPVLKTLRDAAGLKRVIVSTYQSVSGAGKEGLDELRNEAEHDFTNGKVAGQSDKFAPSQYERTKFARPISFNLIPQIDVFATSVAPTAATYGQAGSVITVTSVAHGLSTGTQIGIAYSAGTGGTAMCGNITITRTGADTFTIACINSFTITAGAACRYVVEPNGWLMTFTVAAGDTFNNYLPLPGEGILANNKVFCTMTNVSSTTIFYG
jgi:hypothetical protein